MVQTTRPEASPGISLLNGTITENGAALPIREYRNVGNFDWAIKSNW
jgi:hypothetical protein